MAFDLFISYSRLDDLDGSITKLIERLNREFEELHGRELKVFFDTAEIRDWDEWRDRILPALQQSHLFLACLTPAYLESRHCEWEVNEYLKREISRGLAGDAIVVVQLSDLLRNREKNPEFVFPETFAGLRHRSNFDLRSLHHLESHIARLIQLIERSEQSDGNVDPFNPHFVGRHSELQHIHDTLALGKLCVLSGPSGIGKTAVAIEYAHAFAREYPGGRWQTNCLGRVSLLPMTESIRMGPGRCLLVLDDVSESEFLGEIESERIFAENSEWLHVIATTSLREQDFGESESRRSFLAIRGLPDADAVQLFESFLPSETFVNTYYRGVTWEIVRALNGFPIAIEVAAAFQSVVSMEDLKRLIWKAEVNDFAEDLKRSLAAMLAPMVLRLSRSERAVLRFAARRGNQFKLSAIRNKLAWDFQEFQRDDEKPGEPSAWQLLLSHLFSLRLWQPTNEVDAKGELRIARMHRLLRSSIIRLHPIGPPPASIGPSPGSFGLPPIGSPSTHLVQPRDSSPGAGIGIRIRPPGSIGPPGSSGPAVSISLPKSIHPLDDNVMFTVYRRKTVAPNKWYSLLAFAHLAERRPDAPPDEPDPVVEVKRQANTLLGAAVVAFKESTEDSSQPIPRSGELMFKPSVPGIEFNPPSRTFKWEEPVHREEFKMRASRELEGQVARGCVRVFLGPIIVAEVNLAFKVDSNVGAVDIAPDLRDHARPFRRVFASYSHKDSAIVERIEKLVQDAHLGLEYLRDVTKLRSGEAWNESLLEMIDTADLFQLFWSTNSMGSEYVKREYEHALARQLPDFVRPVYWEKPFPERPADGLPPEALKRLHFEELLISEAVRVPKQAQPVSSSIYCSKCGSKLGDAFDPCPFCGAVIKQTRKPKSSFERGFGSDKEVLITHDQRIEIIDPHELEEFLHEWPASVNRSWIELSRRYFTLETILSFTMIGSTVLGGVLLLFLFISWYFSYDFFLLAWLLIGCSILFAISWIIFLMLRIRDR